jgi:hypothetical protein
MIMKQMQRPGPKRAVEPLKKKSGRDVKLTAHLHLVPRSRMVELYVHSPTCIHGLVLNYLPQGQLDLFLPRLNITSKRVGCSMYEVDEKCVESFDGIAGEGAPGLSGERRAK